MEINNSSLVIINASVQAIVHLSKKYRYSDPQLSHELNEIIENIHDALCEIQD